MSDQPQGPVDPHGPGGIDAPAPPGGPQRTDDPGAPQSPVEPEPATPEYVEQDGSDDTADDGADSLQQENAETSLDQPSQ